MFTCALYIARGRNTLLRANVFLHFVVFLGDIFVAVILRERIYRSQAEFIMLQPHGALF
jgi:hypothetical protein